MKIAIDHVQIAIPRGGEELADTFYVDQLGFRVQPKPPVLAARGGRWYEKGATRLHLGVDEDFRPARKAHVALVVDDYEPLRSQLHDAGFATTSDDAIDGVTRCYVDDPFGNRLEIMSGR